MSVERKGFVGLFNEPLGRKDIEELVILWLERYGMIEQTMGGGSQVLTQVLQSAAEIVWEENMQFRILSGEQFAWIYVTQNNYVIETTGLSPHNGSTLCHDVLLVAGCREVIDEHNDKRLDELEAEGLM